MGRVTRSFGREYITLTDLKTIKSVEDLTGIFCCARFSDKAEAEICDSIFPRSSDFLKGNEMRQLIRRDIDDPDVKKIIANRKALIARIYPYFDNIVRLFDFPLNEDLSGFIEHLEDILEDFPYIVKNNRKDKAKRELKSKISGVRMAVVKLKQAMSDSEAELESGFGSNYISYTNLVRANGTSRRDWHDLLFDIEYLDVLAELELLKLDKDAEHTQYLGNSGKAHIVDAAHWMSAAWHGPRLVTTPGSDFSLLCSWLYEIAGGSDDESLAGAINRYSRSNRRKDVDEFRSEKNARGRDIENEDNFMEVQERLNVAREQFRRNFHLLDASAMSLRCKALILTQLEESRRRIDEAPLKYGPNLVWADRISETELRKHRDEFDAHRKDMLEKDVAIGRARRGLD